VSVPVYGRRFADGAGAMAAYASAFDCHIVRAGLDVSFVRGQLDGVWFVWWLGQQADPDMLDGGVPVQVPDAVANMLRARRRQWAQVAGDVVVHHGEGLHIDLTQQP
jgi:hypothetical protein